MTPEQRALFKQAVFRGAPLPADWPAHVAIITACDPDGRPALAEDNRAADEALAAELRVDGYRVHRITGGSVDGVHLEPGWGVPIGLSEAVEYGRRYRQLAVFYVQDGGVSLVDCADGASEDLQRPFRVL